MLGTKTLALVGTILGIVTAAVPAAAQGTDYSQLPRNADLLRGTIEGISSVDHTLTLRASDGTRRTIHYDTETVVYTGAGGASADVAPGQEAVVRCRRQIAAAMKHRPDLCMMRLFADRVYLAAY